MQWGKKKVNEIKSCWIVRIVFWEGFEVLMFVTLDILAVANYLKEVFSWKES